MRTHAASGSDSKSGRRIGSGVAYADARPIVPGRVAADIDLINGLAQWDNEGTAIPSGAAAAQVRRFDGAGELRWERVFGG